jgi:hypothetical protein
VDESRGLNDEVPNDELYHDDDTWKKVYHALSEAGVDIRVARYSMTLMQRAGILFRERRKNSND